VVIVFIVRFVLHRSRHEAQKETHSSEPISTNDSCSFEILKRESSLL